MGSLAVTLAKLPNYQITQFPNLRYESQVFRQRTRNRHLKQRPRTIRINGKRATAREEHCNLRLPANRRGCNRWSSSDVGQEGVRIFAEAHTQRKGQIVAEERCPVFQVAGADQRCCGWVRHGLIATGELHDHRLGQIARQWLLADKRSPCHRIAGLAEPAVGIFHGLNCYCAGNIIDYGTQVPQRAVVIEQDWRTSIEPRWHTNRPRLREQELEIRAEAHNINNGATRHVGYASLHIRLNAKEDGAVNSAEGLSGVIDTVGVEIRQAIAIGINAALNSADHLHQISRSLLQGIARSNAALRTQHKRG